MTVSQQPAQQQGAQHQTAQEQAAQQMAQQQTVQPQTYQQQVSGSNTPDEPKGTMHYVSFTNQTMAAVMWYLPRWPPKEGIFIELVNGVAKLGWHGEGEVPGMFLHEVAPPDGTYEAEDYCPYPMIDRKRHR